MGHDNRLCSKQLLLFKSTLAGASDDSTVNTGAAAADDSAEYSLAVGRLCTLLVELYTEYSRGFPQGAAKKKHPCWMVSTGVLRWSCVAVSQRCVNVTGCCFTASAPSHGQWLRPLPYPPGRQSRPPALPRPCRTPAHRR